MEEMAPAEKHAGISGDQTGKTSMRTGSSVITMSSEKWWFLIKIEVYLAVEATQREEMRGRSRNQVDKAICVVRTTGCCSATECIKNFSFPFAENVNRYMTYCIVRNKTLDRSFTFWSRSDTSMHVSVTKIVKERFLTLVAAVVMQWLMNTGELELKQDPPLTEEIVSQIDCSP